MRSNKTMDVAALNECEDKVSELTHPVHAGRGGGLGGRHKSGGSHGGTVSINEDLDDSISSMERGNNLLHPDGDNVFSNPVYEHSYSRSRTRHRPPSVTVPPVEVGKVNLWERKTMLMSGLIIILSIGVVLVYMLLAAKAEHAENSMERVKAILPETPLYQMIDADDLLNYVEYHVKVGFSKDGTTDDDTPFVEVDVVQRAGDDDEWVAIGELSPQRSYQYGNVLLYARGSFDITCNSCNGPQFALRFTSNTAFPTALNIHIIQLGAVGRFQVLIAGLLLVFMYIGIATDVMHRTLVALAGLFSTLFFMTIMGKAPSLEETFEWLHEGVLTLLLGMMIVVTVFGETGLFEWVAMRAYMLSKGSYLRLMILLTMATACLSAFLGTVTTMLLIAPVTIRLVGKMLKMDPRPMLLAECMMSNIGGTATMVGDPPNIIIGASLREHLGFVDFIINLTPLSIITYIACLGALALYYRKELRKPLHAPTDKAALDLYRIKKPQLLLYISIVFGAMLVLFFTEPIHHVNVAWIALMGAVAMLVLAHPSDIVHILEVVEWDTLLFFSALFMMIEGLAEMGLIKAIGDTLGNWIEACPPSSRLAVAILILLWVSGLASAFLDNIPYTTTMVPVVLQLSNSPALDLPVKPLAWAVALSACFGGNGTLIGSATNVVTVGLATRAGYPITFMQWLKVGFPILLLSLTVATIYTMILYVAIGFEG